MADKLYAWSPIVVGERNVEGKQDPTELRRVINPGESVSQDDLGLSDEQWEQLKGSSAVRAMEYPKIPETYQGTPVQFLQEQARKAADVTLAEAELSEENMAAIQAANAASTGTELPIPEGLEPGTGPSSEATPASGGNGS